MKPVRCFQLLTGHKHESRFLPTINSEQNVHGANGGNNTAALTERHQMTILMPQNAKRNKQTIELTSLLNVNPVHSMTVLIQNKQTKQVSILLMLKIKNKYFLNC